MYHVKPEVREYQKRLVTYALIESHGNIRKAARILGKHPITMDRWITILGLREFARRCRYGVVHSVAFSATRVLVFATTLVYAAHSLI